MRNLSILLAIIFSLYSWTIQSKVNKLLIKESCLLKQQDSFVYDFVDEMPQFPGGEVGFNKYINDNLKYPNRIKKTGVSGQVYTEFIIEENGEVTHQKVYLGISRELEGEALKLVKKMPNWIPGKNKNKLVRVKLILPINFLIK